MKLLPDEVVAGTTVTPVVSDHDGTVAHFAAACPKCYFETRLASCGDVSCFANERDDEHRVYFLLPDDALKARLRGEI